jgi:dephospho-CoA kinase
VTAAFERQGIEVVDTDAIARELTAPGGAAMAAIEKAFGGEYILPDGSLDRARMRKTVFADPSARARLEGVLHPLIRARANQRVTASSADYVVLVVPLLVESGAYWDLVDRVLVVDCEQTQQLERVMRRDGISEAMAKAMLSAQAGREARLARANDVIDNRGEAADVDSAVRRLHRDYLRRATTENGHTVSQPLR